MPESESGFSILIGTSTWGGGAERDWIVRSVAGALSRSFLVSVVAAGERGQSGPDGAFDVHRVGSGASPDKWPDADRVSWPAIDRVDCTLSVASDPVALRLLASRYPSATHLVIAGRYDAPNNWGGALAIDDSARDQLRLASCRVAADAVGFHLAVNALAAQRPHSGIASNDYLLVLTDRRGLRVRREPALSPTCAWLAALFPRVNLVIVEDGRASLWRSRSADQGVSIGTRMDLWRLMAHARAMVDLAPGSLVARECAEALTLGTPIVVPEGSAAADYAGAGGGVWYADLPELASVTRMALDPALARALGEQGRILAGKWQGDPAPYVDRVVRGLRMLTESVIEPS